MLNFLNQTIFGLSVTMWLIIAGAVILAGLVFYLIFRQKCNAFIKKHKEIFLYLLFGVLTTLVNYAVYFPLANIPGLSEKSFWVPAVNVIAWIVSVAFAFVVNKKYVFESKTTAKKDVLKEAVSFTGSRVVSFLIEEGLLILGINLIGLSQNDTKVIVSVVVIILNYVFSKFIVFRKAKKS